MYSVCHPYHVVHLFSLATFFGALSVNATNRRQHTRVTETYTTTTPNDTSGESAFESDSEVFFWSVSGASSPYNIIQISVLVVSAFCLNGT